MRGLKPMWTEWTRVEGELFQNMFWTKADKVEQCEIRTQHCLAVMQVTTAASKRKSRWKLRGLWKYGWKLEFHPCAGWDMRFYCSGVAKSGVHAKEIATNTALAFISSTIKHTYKLSQAKRVLAENAVLTAEIHRLRHNAGLLRYVIDRDIKDVKLRKEIRQFATVERIG